MFVLWRLSVFLFLLFALVLRSRTLLLLVALRSLLLFAVLVRCALFVVLVMCYMFVSLFVFVFFVRVLRVRVIVRATGRVLCSRYCG